MAFCVRSILMKMKPHCALLTGTFIVALPGGRRRKIRATSIQRFPVQASGCDESRRPPCHKGINSLFDTKSLRCKHFDVVIPKLSATGRRRVTRGGVLRGLGGRMRRQLLVGIILLGLLTASGALLPALGAAPASGATSSTPIIIGGDGDASLNAGAAQGFEAGIYRFNKGGGLDGRKIEYIGFLDDAFSPQTALTNAQEFVQDKHAMFVAPLVSAVATASVGDFLAGAKVPFLGWAESTPFQAESKWGFGIDGLLVNPAVEMSSQSQYLVATGDTKDPSKFKLAYVGVDYASAITGVQALAGVSRYLGMKVVLIVDTVPVIGSVNYAGITLIESQRGIRSSGRLCGEHFSGR